MPDDESIIITIRVKGRDLRIGVGLVSPEDFSVRIILYPGYTIEDSVREKIEADLKGLARGDSGLKSISVN